MSTLRITILGTDADEFFFSLRAESHVLTDVCWKKCVTGGIKGSALDKNEQGCLANCVDRFFDVNLLTMKHLSNMRQ